MRLTAPTDEMILDINSVSWAMVRTSGGSSIKHRPNSTVGSRDCVQTVQHVCGYGSKLGAPTIGWFMLRIGLHLRSPKSLIVYPFPCLWGNICHPPSVFFFLCKDRTFPHRSHEWWAKLLTTRNGHGQSGWSPYRLWRFVLPCYVQK